MKRSRLITVLLPLLSLTSCDKAKNLAEQATHAVKEQVAAHAGTSSSNEVKSDPELAKLADQTAEGVVFRKDLPFPEQIEITTTRSQEWSGRFYQSSAIERRVETIKGTRHNTEKLERAGNQVRHTLEESGFTIPSPDDPEGAKKTLNDPLSSITPANTTQVFRKSGNTWTADPSGGFRSAALAKDLAPVLDQLLIENALAPRPLWFSAKKRFKPGDEVTVTNETLPMLVGGNASGTLKLKLESFDAVHGHPCAVFSVSGDYRRKDVPDFEGIFTDEDVTIQSGKLWLSILHPIILKEELDTIQTVSSGSRGGQKSKGQGSIKVSVERQWKSLAP
jgi:hypothetical protein